MWDFIPPLEWKGEYKSMTFIDMHIQESKLSERKEYEEVTVWVDGWLIPDVRNGSVPS